MTHLKNSAEGYGWISIAFHWLMALAIFGLFGLGLYMVELTYYDAWYKGSLDLHKAAGMVVALTWVGRLMWRFMNTSPQNSGDKTWEHQVAHLVHILLYVFMLALFVSGYLISTADGRSINVFGWFEIPASLMMDNQEDIAGIIHWGLAWSLMGLVALHAAAAVKHHVVDKDRTLMRMLKAN